MSQIQLSSSSQKSTEYVRQAEKLSLNPLEDRFDERVAAPRSVPDSSLLSTQSLQLRVETGFQLCPLTKHKLNVLKNQAERSIRARGPTRSRTLDDQTHGLVPRRLSEAIEADTGLRLGSAMPPTRTHPLFPPLPLHGPPSLLRDAQCAFLKLTSFWLSTALLAVIVLGALFTSVPNALRYFWLWLTFRDPDKGRPFQEEGPRRRMLRKEQEPSWEYKRQVETAKRG